MEVSLTAKRLRRSRDAERAQKRRDAIDEFAARPDKAHRASNLDMGVSIWNARPPREPSAAYWAPLPDPVPKQEREWERRGASFGNRVTA